MMQNKNVVLKNKCHSRGMLSGIPTSSNDTQGGDPRQRHSGMTANFIMAHGFTLIELLVVVLIIGILAAVALPQYQKAVEKSRLTEALVNMKTFQDIFQMYILENGVPNYPDWMADGYFNNSIELSGGTWNTDTLSYNTAYFTYEYPACGGIGCFVSAIPHHSQYELELSILPATNTIQHDCYTNKTDLGRYICETLKGQGWTYKDENHN